MHHYYDANDTFWGELTSVGMRTHQNLGQQLRKDYIQKMGFLGENYDPYQIEVYSTDKNRTHLSVRSQLLGLYPLGTGDKMVEGVDSKYRIPPYSKKEDSPEQKYALPEGYQEIPIL